MKTFSAADDRFSVARASMELPIQDKIAFRSGFGTYVEGMDYNDNARALFEYLLEQGANRRYSMVWFLHDPEAFPELKEMENVSLVSYEWENSPRREEYSAYFHHLCTARYLFTTDTSFWMRYCREGQIRVNLWHGCGFKNRKVWKTGSMEESYEFMTVTSPLYARIHERLYGLRPEQLLVTGLAKEDWLFRPVEESLPELFGVPEASRYVFWLPTFRMAREEMGHLSEYRLPSETGLPIVRDASMARELDSLLKELDMCLMVKLHPVQDSRSIAHWDLDRLCVMEHREIAAKNLPINRLLAKADALISDYSSVAVDYMLLDRPIGFLLEDEEEYGRSRGFVFDDLQAYLPGAQIASFEGMKEFLREIRMGVDSSREKRRRLLPILHAHGDGNNCRRIAEALGLAEYMRENGGQRQ